MSGDIGMTDADSDALDAAEAHALTLDAADGLRARIRDLERAVLRQSKRAEGFRQALDGSATTMLIAAGALNDAARREDQIRALLELWQNHCAAIGRGEVLTNDTDDTRAAAMAATIVCTQDLAAILACGNPACPGCASKSADQPTTAGSGDDAPSP